MKPQIWPVIHVSTLANAIEDVQLVKDAGCDGVFLISMNGQDNFLELITSWIRSDFPDFKIGVNFLSIDADKALEKSLLLGCDATWSDDPGVSSHGYTKVSERISGILEQKPDHLYFGSVAFKYQPKELDPVKAALNAALYGMIPTTSGSRTGQPPTVKKLKLMKSGCHNLAVASGISFDNVLELGKYVTHILIASSINTNDRIDKIKLEEFMTKVKEL